MSDVYAACQRTGRFRPQYVTAFAGDLSDVRPKSTSLPQDSSSTDRFWQPALDAVEVFAEHAHVSEAIERATATRIAIQQPERKPLFCELLKVLRGLRAL